MSETAGNDFRLYYDSAANYSSPTWGDHQTSLGSIGHDPNYNEFEVPKRIPTVVFQGGRDNHRLTFAMNYDPENAFHTAVRAAIRGKTRIHLALADADITVNDTNYWHGWWLLKGPLDASLDQPGGIAVEGMPHHSMGTNDAEIPAYVTVGA